MGNRFECTGATTLSQPPDPFEFLKSLWGPMGLPLPGSMGLGLDMVEIDRRIAELKSVENWLNMNLNVLRTAVHSLEMQKSGLAAMREASSAANPEGAQQAPPRAGEPSKE
jgi:hypothetical protein